MTWPLLLHVDGSMEDVKESENVEVEIHSVLNVNIFLAALAAQVPTT